MKWIKVCDHIIDFDEVVGVGSQGIGPFRSTSESDPRPRRLCQVNVWLRGGACLTLEGPGAFAFRQTFLAHLSGKLSDFDQFIPKSDDVVINTDLLLPEPETPSIATKADGGEQAG